MAATVTLVGPSQDARLVSSMANGLGQMVFTVTMDSSYLTGGEPVDFTGYFPNGVAWAGTANDAQDTYTLKYDLANKLMRAFDAATNTEVSGGTNLSAVTTKVFVVGFH